MRRYRLENREGDSAEVRVDGATIDGELRGHPLRVYSHLFPARLPSTAEGAQDSALHVLRELCSSGWRIVAVDENGTALPIPDLGKPPREDRSWQAIGIHPDALEEIVIDVIEPASGIRPSILFRDPRLDRTRRLWIWHWGDANGEFDYRAWVKAFASRRWPALRSLSIGYGPDAYQTALIGPLTETHWKVAPSLEEVDISGAIQRLDPFVAPSLRSLIVSSGKSSPRVAEAILASKYPSIETLHLELDVFGALGGLPLARLRPFLARTDVPHLRTLSLGALRGGGGLCDAVLRAPWLGGLRELKLLVCEPDDSDRRALASAAPMLAHLEKLTVSSSLRPPERLHPRLEVSPLF